jgi:hypothetical protein
MRARSIVSSAAAVFLALVGLTAPVGAASSGTTSWTVYDWNPSGHALSPRVAAKSSPPIVAGDQVTFNFLSNTFTALVVTRDEALTGDLTGKTLSDTVTVAGLTGTFLDQNGGGCLPDRQSVRLYFTSPGFEFTNFWWSNPVSFTLSTNGSATITGDLSDPTQWSDWNGKGGATAPADFLEAAANVQSVGLSFGGGCFFENGVTTSDGSGTFTSDFSEV